MYQFDGQWEFSLQFEILKHFRNASGPYTGFVKGANTGKVKVSIVDEMTPDPDPKPGQIEALNYLLENSEIVFLKLAEYAFEEYPKIKKRYYGDEEAPEDMPDLKHVDEIRNLIGVGNIFIHCDEKEGLANIGFECGCTWDEEHGLGIVMNRTELIRIGQAEEAFSSNQTAPGYIHPQKPIKHKAHPKYGTLKPYQISENKYYETRLISGKHNDTFIQLVNEGEINLRKKPLPNVNSFMDTAIRSKNYEIAQFLLDKGLSIGSTINHCMSGGFNQEVYDFVIKNGGHIDSKDRSGNSLLLNSAQRLIRLYDVKKQERQYNKVFYPDMEEKMKKEREILERFIRLGANPYIKNRSKYDIFEIARNLPEDFNKEYKDFLWHCIRTHHPDKINEPEEMVKPLSTKTIVDAEQKPQKKPRIASPVPPKQKKPWWKFW